MMLLITSVLSAAVVGAIGYQSGRSSLRDSVFDRLTEIRQSQSRQLREGIRDLKDSLVIYARGATSAQAIQAFTAGVRSTQCREYQSGPTAVHCRLLHQPIRTGEEEGRRRADEYLQYSGQTALTLEPVTAAAYALEEVTVLRFDRDVIEDLVSKKPMLLQDFGRAIEERRESLRRALAAAQD